MPRLDSHSLLLLGTLLFLSGLLTGLTLPLLRNRRMGLSAHLVGVQHGMVLWVLGLIEPRLGKASPFDPPMFWAFVLGLYGLWLAMLLAAVWGASRALPMAGGDYTSTPRREALVKALVYGSATLVVLATLGLLLRLF